MRKPFSCDFHPSFLRPAATPQRAAPFPSTTSGGVFLRHHPASSPSCPPSNSNYIALVFLLFQYRFPKTKAVSTSARAQCAWRGLNAHGASSMHMARRWSPPQTSTSFNFRPEPLVQPPRRFSTKNDLIYHFPKWETQAGFHGISFIVSSDL